MKRYTLILVIFSIFKALLAQVDTGGVVNLYYEVQTVNADNIILDASEDLSDLSAGDKVLLIQMKGADLNTDPGFETIEGDLENENNCGLYELLIVESVNGGSRTVTFNVNLLNAYNVGEGVQLVKIFEDDWIRVTSDVTAYDWDSIKGGVIAILAHQKLELLADIDASGSGFKGALPEANNFGWCRSSLTDTFYFQTNLLDRAGLKGEGASSSSFDYLRGLGALLNGGGGGNGLYSGGGGGGNYGEGGQGGHQDNSCGNPFILLRAEGGMGTTEHYLYTPALFGSRVIMGGGGGTGTQNSGSGRTSTAGANGGGIVIIIADTILCSSTRTINANGSSVSGIATAAGGGGGAGGAVFMDITTVIGNLNVSVLGGSGGPVTTYCSGSGGGGGGGIIWYAGTTNQFNSTTTDGGAAGTKYGTCDAWHNGSNGSNGAIQNNMKLPLNGFLFNTIYGIDTICAGQVPNTLIGSMPKGGDDTFSYQWQRSVDQLSWSNIGETADSLEYTPSALSQTTYFRRVVASGGFSDTSKVVEIYAYPAIQGNTINGTDTICYANTAQQIIGNTPTGGNGTYAYAWQYSTNPGLWNTLLGDTFIHYSPGSLTVTTHYRRFVQSADVCQDISDTATITVLPLIANNNLESVDEYLCYNDSASIILATTPTGGDTYYEFLWINSMDNSSWSDVTDSDVEDLIPGPLTDTTYFKRIVYSGNDKACVDTTPQTIIKYVLTDITANTIQSNQHICYSDIPATIEGFTPGNGDGSYDYMWLIRTTEPEYNSIPGESDPLYTPTTPFTETSYISRLVYSGPGNACADTSAEVEIEVVNEIINDLQSTDQTLCIDMVPLSFTENPATGGDGAFSYTWQLREEGTGTWQDAPVPNGDQSYSSEVLDITTYFRRQVESDICTNYSDSITITVLEHIVNNLFASDTVLSACYNTSKSLSGTTPQGGEPGNYIYTWELSDDGSTWTGAPDNDDKDFNTPVITSDVFVRRLVFSGLGNVCKDTTSAIKIISLPLPEGDIIGGIDTLCEGVPKKIHFNLSGISPFGITVGDTENQFTKSNITQSTDSIEITLLESATIEMITIEDDSGCLADNSQFLNTYEITVFNYPQVFAGEDEDICGLQYTLSGNKNGEVSQWIKYTGNISDVSNPNATVTVPDEGDYTYVLKEWNWHCDGMDSVVLTFRKQPLVVDAGADQNLFYKFSAILNASPAEIGTGYWTTNTDAIVIDELESTTNVNALREGSNYFIWNIANGVCAVIKDSVNIFVDLTTKLGFSPNGDGKNEEFCIELDSETNAEIIIFNKWGNIVFESKDFNLENCWDGTSLSGKDLPPDTYYYILKLKNDNRDIPDKKGYIELRR